MRRHLPLALLFALLAVVLAMGAQAQDVPRLPQPGEPAPTRPGAPMLPTGSLGLSLDEAVQIALERAYAVRLADLDVQTAEAQVREARGGLYPRIEGTSSYTRNLAQANPFAGSAAGSLFSGGAATGWLQFNELARTDDDPATTPITLTEYNRRISDGQDAIGYNPANAANPFGTDNSVVNQLSITQPIYSPTGLAAVKGARSLVEINEVAVEQSRDETIAQVRQLYYQAALSAAQVDVLDGSLGRTRRTYDDAVLLVAQGVRPMLEQLNAEVDVANVRTQLSTARTQADGARGQLLLALGLPTETPVALTTPLDVPAASLLRVAALDETGTLDLSVVDLDDRPDLRQAALAVELQEVQRDITRAASRPGLSAFANLSYNGNIPDDRSSVFAADPNDPFTFEESSTGAFSSDYWQRAASVGLRLNWTLFDGRQTHYRAQQDQIAIDRATIQLEQARNAAALEVANAARMLRSAAERLAAQRQTVQTAETAYAFATERLEVGVAPLLDVRLASDNLEQARLGLLQAAYDALVARSDYERATGSIQPTGLDTEPIPAFDPAPTLPAVISGARP